MTPSQPAARRARTPLLAVLALGALGGAQAFPEGATSPSATALKAHLDDRVFATALADGTTWRLEFKSGGYLFVDTSRGGSFKGEWKTEDGRICTKMGLGAEVACSEARLHDGMLHVKRAANGELIRYTPK